MREEACLTHPAVLMTGRRVLTLPPELVSASDCDCSKVVAVYTEAHCVLQEAVEIVALYPDDVEQGVARLLQVSRERWAAIQGGRTCDDITAVVTKLNLNAKTEAVSRDNAVAHAAHS